MTNTSPRTGQEQAPDRSAPDRGLRDLVVAGAARIEAEDAHRTLADWRPADREWSRRSSWRTRQQTQEGAADEQQG